MSSPTGTWVVRGEPRGVPIGRDLFPGRGFSIGRHLRRWLVRDRAWIVTVRPLADDPMGVPVFERLVATKAEVEAELDRVVEQIRVGAPVIGGAS